MECKPRRTTSLPQTGSRAHGRSPHACILFIAEAVTNPVISFIFSFCILLGSHHHPPLPASFSVCHFIWAVCPDLSLPGVGFLVLSFSW